MTDNSDEYVLLSTNNTGGMYTTLTEKYKNRKRWEEPNHNEIKAYIPGTIDRIYSKPGDKVKEGETLLILVAMKMENKVVMPFDGTVKSINVSEGDKVPKGTVMVEVE